LIVDDGEPKNGIEDEEEQIVHELMQPAETPKPVIRNVNRRSGSVPTMTRQSIRIKDMPSKDYRDNRRYERRTFARAAIVNRSRSALKLHRAIAAEVSNLPKLGEPGSEVSAFRPEPKNLNEMLRLPADIREHWLKADRVELKNLIDNQTFYLASPRKGEIVYPTLSLYKVKLNSRGLLDKLKARIVVRGDLMKEYLPHGDPWSPTASARALKMFIADSARHRARTKQLDFIGAFLQAKMRYRMFVTLPAKYGELFPEYKEWCGRPLLLLKSMYGITYSGKMWYQELDEWLVDKNGGGFEHSTVEPCLYLRDYGNGTVLKLLSYVDDGLLFCNDPIKEEEFLAKLKKKFQYNFLGQAHWFLGMRLIQEGNFDISLDQSRYAKNIVQRYLFESNADIQDKKFNKPLPDGFIATKEDVSKDEKDVKALEKEFGFQYPSIVGALIYILSTRPDLSFAVHKLARFMTVPGRKHFEAMVHVLHYLRDNILLGLKFYSDFSRAPLYKILSDGNIDWKRPLITFSDSSWQDCIDTGRSTTRHYCIVGEKRIKGLYDFNNIGNFTVIS